MALAEFFSKNYRDTVGMIVATPTDTFTSASKVSRGGYGLIGLYNVIGFVVDVASGGGFVPNSPDWGGLGSLPEGVLTIPYEYDWDMPISGSPVSYSISSGSLPAGIALLALGSTGGRLTGTPTVAGTYTFTLLATNAYGTDSQSFSLVVVSVSGGGYSYAFAA